MSKHDTMITINPLVLLSHRRRDGTYLVYIRVYYAGKSRRIPTGIVCRSEDLTRSGRIKSRAVLDAAEIVMKKMRDAVDTLSPGELAGKDVDWVADRIKNADRVDAFALDFFDFADALVASKSPGARGQYITALNAFAAFLGRRRMDVNDITRSVLLDFLAWLSTKPVSFDSPALSPSGRTRIPNGAESRDMAKLAHIYERAKERYNDEDSGVIVIPRSPFRGLIPKHPPSRGQKSLGVELMQRIIDARHPVRKVQDCLDAFVVSFATMGANLADLYDAQSVNVLRDGTVWHYWRRKTRTRRADSAEMRVTVPEEISGRIARLQDGPDGWWLPSLHRMSSNGLYITDQVNRGLARWCADEGVPVFTFYAARHTWATLARRAGVEKATIDECLCHIGDFRLTDIYAERSWDLLDGANRRVLDLFAW